jgi:hypothetical protein
VFRQLSPRVKRQTCDASLHTLKHEHSATITWRTGHPTSYPLANKAFRNFIHTRTKFAVAERRSDRSACRNTRLVRIVLAKSWPTSYGGSCYDGVPVSLLGRWTNLDNRCMNALFNASRPGRTYGLYLTFACQTIFSIRSPTAHRLSDIRYISTQEQFARSVPAYATRVNIR